MGSVINFNEVQEQQERPVFKTVKKGAQQLTITSVEEGTSQSGKEYLDVTFHSNKDDADFKHKFYTSPKALVKLMELFKGFTGSKPTSSLETDAVIAALVGQEAYCIVDANIVSKQVGDKVYNNEYATFLRFRDFANKTTPYKDEDARTEDRSAPASAISDLVNSTPDDSDLPF